MPHRDDQDPMAPQKEAAIFYGMFLRGYPAEALRQEIDIPKSVLDKWMRSPRFEPSFRDTLRRIYEYRKQVLAIFDELVFHERSRSRIQ
jgi:hypothetical protein